MSGSFWVSITAAIGIPKFEAGPQKSEQGVACQRYIGKGVMEACDKLLSQSAQCCRAGDDERFHKRTC